MRTLYGRIAAFAFIALLAIPAAAAEVERPTPPKTVSIKDADKPGDGSQQNRMKSCNAEAAKKSLKGDERKAFMSQCLKRH